MRRQGLAVSETDEFERIKARASAMMTAPNPSEVEREFIQLLRRKDYDHILLIVTARIRAERCLWFGIFFMTLTLDVLVRVLFHR